MAALGLDESSIFNEARHILSPEDRHRYLERACAGNMRVRERVEVLLRAHEQATDFLDSPGGALGLAFRSSPEERPGSCIGPYRLLDQIGEGGFGVVYRAEQREPVHRLVAVKLLKFGVDTRQVVARFEAERQALALMGHPNIAQLIDGGRTDSGRPYFVMELVEGVPITRFCDENRLSIDARLELFITACRAIQHAHQKGVIHRDIKPSNVLVMLRDGTPSVKVIDFGVAKAVEQKLTEKTLVTMQGLMIGTPAYMSPEQAGLGRLDVDTRGDIYSLGVLLYELLTGTTPLDATRLKTVGDAEMLRLVREVDPPRPSAQVAAPALGVTTIAAEDRSLTGSRLLARRLAGDLDCIAMKALEKDRSRRYATPDALADDVERHLRREAILAHPPSAAYRLSRLARRHRAALVAALLVAAALVSGSAVAFWQAIVATHAKRDALAAAAAAKTARQKAETHEAEIRTVLDFVEGRVFAAVRPVGEPGGMGPEVTLRRALEAALVYVDKSFADRPLVEARLRGTLGNSFLELGKASIAAEQHERARALYTRWLGPRDENTLRSMNDLVRSYRALGGLRKALALCLETLEARKARLGTDHPDTLSTLSNLANLRHDLGQYPAALGIREQLLARRRAKLGTEHPDTIASMRDLANSYAVAGRFPEGMELEVKALALSKRVLGPDHPDTLIVRNNLAASYADMHRYEDAIALQTETLGLLRTKMGHDHPLALTAAHNVAKAHADLKQYEQAEKICRETLALQKMNPGPTHPDTIQTIYSLANHLGRLERYAEALAYHEEGWKLRRAVLGPNHRQTLYSMWGVASNLFKLDRGRDAVLIADECLRRAAGENFQPGFALLADLRLEHFRKAGDPDGCRSTAELWDEVRGNDPACLYHSARYWAATASVLRADDAPPEGIKRAECEAATERAVDRLRQALAAGYKDLAGLEQDKDLADLRERADFRTLVAGLKTSRP